MSYSFNVRAATKAEVLTLVATKFDEVCASQPVHKRDAPAVLAHASAVVGLLADDEAKGVSVACSGYVTWNTGDEVPLSTVSINCQASQVSRAPA